MAIKLKVNVEAETSRLDHLIQTQPDLADYARDLSQFLQENGIGAENFSVLRRSEDVIAMAATLLGHLEMDPIFLDSPINAFLLLGIADAYIDASRDRSLSEEEKTIKQESLLLSLGLASYESTRNGYATHSGYMLTNFDGSGNKLKLIKPLHGPSFARKTAAEESIEPAVVTDVVHQQTDELATRRFAKSGEIAEKPARAYIENIAKQLGILPTKVPPISFTILADSQNPLKIGARAVTLYYPDGRREIVLPNNWNKHDARHEIIHAIVPGLLFGFRGNIGRGVDEAMTEMLTGEPSSYEDQRKILAMLYEKMGPVFEHNMKNAYVHGSQRSLNNALGELVRQFGIQAVYQLFYLSSGTTELQVSDSGYIDRAFLSPESVMDFFNPQSNWTHFLMEAEVID